jgi:hypothetical protein
MFLVLMQGIGGINWPTIGLEYRLMILWFTFYSLHCDYFLWCSNNGFIPLVFSLEIIQGIMSYV